MNLYEHALGNSGKEKVTSTVQQYQDEDGAAIFPYLVF